jgi:hypothetical protein
MTDISSIASSAAAMITKPVTELNKAATAATASFASTLSNVQTAIVGKPKTGITAGPTYEAGTLTGQTKAAFNTAFGTAKTTLGIKP